MLGSAGAAVIAMTGSAAAQMAAPETVTITGSRLPVQGLVAASPVAVVNNEDVKINGTINVENLLSNLPQAFASQGGAISNGSSGTATVNLRNLGANRTLVLIDGKRLQPGDPNTVGPDTAAPDINNIPAALIDHIEVLTGGASAVYGSDAIAGVVNFVMRKDFEGVEFDGTWSAGQHNNDNSVARDTIAASAQGFPQAPNSVFDGRNIDITGIIGTNSQNGKGNITAYLGFRNTQPVLQSQRDFSACSEATDFAGGFFCVGSSNAAVGRLSPQQNPANPNNGLAFRTNTNGTITPYSSARDAFNFAPYNYLQRPDERYQAGAFGHYEVTPMFDFFTSVMFMDDHTVAQIAPSGLFRGAGKDVGLYDINCDNPLLTPSALTTLCTGLGPTDNARVDIGRRFVEAGPRRDDLRHTAYRMIVGVQGQITSNWSYELFAQYGTTVYQEEYLNDASVRNIANALQVVNSGGTPTCKAALPGGNDPNCVPLDIFTLGHLTPAMISYISTPGFKEGDNTEQTVGFNITGDLGDMFKSAMAMNPISVALGADYMRDHLALRVDQEFASGDLAGQGGPTPSVEGAYDVKEYYGEIGIPLIEGRPFFESLRLDGGARYSDYTQAGTVWSWKIDAEWAPTMDFKLRGSLQRAVRAPNVIELFQPNSVGLWGGTDPCAGSAPSLTASQCALTGVSSAQYGHIDQCPAAQCSALFGGNLALKPEDADSKTAGVVLTPSFFENFTATIDYFNIKVNGLIATLPQSDVLTGCATGVNPGACALIHRTPGTGSIFGLFGYVSSQNINTGFLSTNGVDIAANYRRSLDDFGFMNAGAISLSLNGTWIDTYKQQNAPGEHVYDCAGLFGLTCTTGNASAPIPTWRHTLRVTWDAPFDASFSVTWRHLSSVKFDGNTNDPVLDAPCGAPCGDLSDAIIPSYDYFDLAARWTLRPGVDLHFGVNNLFDKDPPLIDTSNLGISGPPYGNANTFPQTYDSLGRVFFVNVTLKY